MNAKRVLRERKALERKAKRHGGELGGREAARLRRREGQVNKAASQGFLNDEGEVTFGMEYDEYE